MTLRERLLKAFEFKNVDGNNHDFERGRQNQCASRREIDAALADVVEALESSVCQEIINFEGSGMFNKHDPACIRCSAIAKLEEALKGLGK